MPELQNRPLRVFLCHASQDKSAVRELYKRLKTEGWIDPWLDEEKLYPGQDWDLEIEQAVEAADAVIVFLSNNSVTKEGYIQRELRFVLRIADFKPEGAVFVIPVRLDDCPIARRLSNWQYVDYFPKNRKDRAYQRLLGSMMVRAEKLGIPTIDHAKEKVNTDKENQALEVAKRAAKIKEIEINAILESAEEIITGEREEKARLGKELEKKEREDRERRETEEKGRKEKEERERKATAKQVPITKQNLRRYGVGGLILVGFISLIFGGNYIFQNLLAPQETTATEPVQTVAPIDTLAPLSTTTDFTEELGVGSTMVSEKDGMVMVYVPAGEFEMGNENGKEDEKPVHTVHLDAFWIDRTEVTIAMYTKCVQNGACDPPSSEESHSPGEYFYYSNSFYDNYPIVSVSWNDAEGYCKWANRRLPTESEWEKAASWDDEKKKKNFYPWSSWKFINCSLANYNQMKYGPSSVLGCVGNTTPVGNYSAGASGYGALDMAGNVWEWVDDWYGVYPGGNPNASNNFGQAYRVLRGGSWNSWNLDDLRSTNRSYGSLEYSSTDIGFRCALSASE